LQASEAIKKRRSVRDFKPEAVEDDTLMELLEAAVNAPTAGNVQPWKFAVVKEDNIKQELEKAALYQSWISRAPAVIVVMADLNRAAAAYGRRGVELYCIQDTAAATQNILLAAVEKGLYGCWIGAFSEKGVSKCMDLPSELRPLVLLPLGYPAAIPSPPPRRQVEEVLF